MHWSNQTLQNYPCCTIRSSRHSTCALEQSDIAKVSFCTCTILYNVHYSISIFNRHSKDFTYTIYIPYDHLDIAHDHLNIIWFRYSTGSSSHCTGYSRHPKECSSRQYTWSDRQGRRSFRTSTGSYRHYTWSYRHYTWLSKHICTGFSRNCR